MRHRADSMESSSTSSSSRYGHRSHHFGDPPDVEDGEGRPPRNPFAFSSALVRRLNTVTPLIDPNFMEDHHLSTVDQRHSLPQFDDADEEEEDDSGAISSSDGGGGVHLAEVLSGRNQQTRGDSSHLENEVAGSDRSPVSHSSNWNTDDAEDEGGDDHRASVRDVWESIAHRTAAPAATQAPQVASEGASARRRLTSGGGSVVAGLLGKSSTDESDGDDNVCRMFEQDQYYSDPSDDDWEVRVLAGTYIRACLSVLCVCERLAR